MMTTSPLDVYENISALKVATLEPSASAGQRPQILPARGGVMTSTNPTDLQPATVMNPANPLAAFRIDGPPGWARCRPFFLGGNFGHSPTVAREQGQQTPFSLLFVLLHGFHCTHKQEKEATPDILLFLFFLDFCVTKQY